MELDKMKEIIKLMKDNDLKVFSLKDGQTDLYLEAQPIEKDYVPIEKNVGADEATSANKPIQAKKESKLIEVRAKQIGIFYTQPDEDSTDTFVSVGDRVEVGDQIGLIEIMKLFNEVHIEYAGVIEEILVANGEPVEYDQVLMLLKPEEE